MPELPFKIYEEIKLECASLIVCWRRDAGQLGARVADYLIKKLDCRLFGEIEPVSFFQLGGITVEDDVARFPQSKLFFSVAKQLLIFQSDAPRAEWHRFLNTILDLAGMRCRVNELYSVGSMVALAAHTAPRQMFAVANSPEMKRVLLGYGLDMTMDYETPEGQRPTISSFLIWVARQRNINGAALWIPVPFYLTGSSDPPSQRKIIEFFNRRFELRLDLADLDKEAETLNSRLASARTNFPELNDYITRLESNRGLSQEENEKLVHDIEKFMKKRE